jgi:hypothetical protein
MFLAKQVTSASLREIGREFGRKHHTLVLRSVMRVDEQRQVDNDLDRVITALLEKIALPRIGCQEARLGALPDERVTPADSSDCSCKDVSRMAPGCT